jgi:hypothetical protein
MGILYGIAQFASASDPAYELGQAVGLLLSGFVLWLCLGKKKQ